MVTLHVATGLPDAVTIVAHSASCFAWPNESTVSPATPTVMATTWVDSDAGEEGRSALTKRSFHHAARKRELPERSAGDALRPAFELDEQPRSFGHFPKRFDLVGLLAVRMVYELFPPARYS